MTKKARRRQIMEEVGYPEKRVRYHGDGGFSYNRSGELLKVELREVIEYVDGWSNAYNSQTKQAWRSHLRDAVGIEYEGTISGEPFTLGELTEIWREVRGDD